MQKKVRILVAFALLVVMVSSVFNFSLAESTYKLKVGCMQSSSHSSVLAFNHFKELVEKESSGRIQVEIYADALLGDENAMQEMITMGTLDMMYTGNLAAYIPLLGALELPYLFRDREHIIAFHDTDAAKELVAPLADYNMVIVAWYENGFRQVTNNVKPIEKASDLKGMLFRTAASPGEIFAFEAAGAVATTITYTELYSSLQQGVVDGQENPIQNIYNAKFYEVQKYLSVTDHIYNSGLVAMRKDLFDSMPVDLQEILLKTIKESEIWQIDYVANNDARMLQEIADKGIIVSYPDKDEMKEAMSGAYEKMYEKFPESKALVEAINAVP